jgi:hypothetical protein
VNVIDKLSPPFKHHSMATHAWMQVHLRTDSPSALGVRKRLSLRSNNCFKHRERDPSNHWLTLAAVPSGLSLTPWRKKKKHWLGGWVGLITSLDIMTKRWLINRFCRHEIIFSVHGSFYWKTKIINLGQNRRIRMWLLISRQLQIFASRLSLGLYTVPDYTSLWLGFWIPVAGTAISSVMNQDLILL